MPPAILFGGSPITGEKMTDREAAMQRILAKLGGLTDDEVFWIERVFTEVLRG